MSLQLFDEPPIVGSSGSVEAAGLPPPLPPLPLPPPERLVNSAVAILLLLYPSLTAIAFTTVLFVMVKGAVYLLLSAVGSVPSVV